MLNWCFGGSGFGSMSKYISGCLQQIFFLNHGISIYSLIFWKLILYYSCVIFNFSWWENWQTQGINILLTSDEHCIGRLVDMRFQIESNAVSANHCRIYRKRGAAEDAENPSTFSTFLQDTRLYIVFEVCLMR